MADDLDFSLPERKGVRPPRGGKGLAWLLALVLAGVAINLGVTLRAGRGAGAAARGRGVMPVEARKQFALKLEQQGLQPQAVAAWKEYLDAAAPDAKEAAQIWYRIGTLYQDAKDFANAVDSYYRSESLAKEEGLDAELGRRVSECLEQMGKFAALHYELVGRVGLGATNQGSEVVAEIGPEKITKADLDRRIETQIDRQLDRMAAVLPEDERLRQKEALLKELSTADQRRRFLNQMVMEEVLYRKARESGLADTPAVRAEIMDADRALLAQRAMDQEMADQIRITAGDLQTWYDAHRADYKRPARVRISVIVVPDAAAADKVLARLKAGADFKQVAGEVSTDATTKTKGGEVDGWIERGTPIPGVGRAPEAQEAVFGAEAGKVVEKALKGENGFHVIRVDQHEAEAQRPFDDVRADVFRDLRAQKEKEVQERLIADLQSRYDVVIHASAFGEPKEK